MAALTPNSARVLQTVGLTTTAILAGASASFSIYTVPRLLESPTPLLLKQFKHMFAAGHDTVPAGTVVAVTSLLYLAYDSRAAGSPAWRGYATAAALALGIIPYTLIVMMGTNKVLLDEAVAEVAAEKVETKAASVKQLLDQWATMNLGRSVLMASAAVTATWTALGKEL
ncbi:hypothetical protein VC83_06587 [Pseudogymnoascus destructans]|uniref:DUF1772 domain-containing protein n=2 Tax=Pseudogymnoascus destructans TaxID=655981 RepID=L8FV69_PSED2|nr:uncharacterized protein VC83_06587 [Pseudogymnoascus destructans]ELR04378.1 hypothetical protein GMDG_06747 [Pseudogymnoascus destructans 20631-21]OAF58217.1 hypothetical protein VC83_06587 [Pseudogymnoascus destructans]